MSIPKPKGLQKEVLALTPEGHTVVLGTAGSGKTTLAILRSQFLAKAHCNANERVLLVTFNKALVTYLNSITANELTNVDVRNYHRFSRGYLSSRKKIGYNDIASNDLKLEIIKEAINKVKGQYNSSTLERDSEVFFEEVKWIQKMDINTLEEYENAERIGRGGTRITRVNRKYFFMVFENYMDIRNAKGYKYDWDDLGKYTYGELLIDKTDRYYKHIIIDEGQDFSPVMLKSLVEAIPEDGSVTYFGDVAQQIYGSRISWRQAGLNPPRVWYFEQNYRNTEPIAKLALAISESKYFKDVPDLVVPKFQIASGPKPAKVNFINKDETDWLIQSAISISKNQTVAILVRDRETVTTIIKKLRENKQRYQELHGDRMYSWNSEPGISVGTYHSAKGLEFDIVFLPYCNKATFPKEDRVIALEGEEEAKREEIKLLYVGVTRAKKGLLITHTGEITDLLPTDKNLYREAIL